METNERAERALRITKQGVWVNVALFLFKLAAGIFGHSQAMTADAIHTLSDFATDIAVLLGIRFSRKPKDADHDYGHGQYETVAAAFVGIFLFYVGAKIGWEAIRSLFDAMSGKMPPRPGVIAFWAAIVSIISKEFLYRKTIAVGRVIENDAVIANAWHHRSDALSSVGTALGIGAAAFLGKRWAIMDPVAAIVTSLLLLKVSVEIVKEQIGALTEKSLSKEVEAEIKKTALSFPALSHPHNLRTHAVGSTIVIDLHVRVDPDMRVADAHRVVSRLEEKFRERFGKDTIINVHIEPLKH